MIASSRQFPTVSRSSRNHDTATDPRFRFVSSDEFRNLSLEQLRAEAPETLYQQSVASSNGGRQDSFFNRELLTPEGERHLFRKMNFLKYRAVMLQKGSRHAARTREIESLLDEAARTRAAIVNANLRLVTAVARKLTTQDPDDLISEGHVILLAAVEKFNYSRGFRFSTYATHALQRHCFRVMQRQQKRRRRESPVSPEYLAERGLQTSSEEIVLDPRLAAFFMNHLEDCLDSREQLILCERFGLKGHSAATLKTVADKMRLSKERVRQLQMGAVEKLQDLATRYGLKLDSSEIPFAVEVD